MKIKRSTKYESIVRKSFEEKGYFVGRIFGFEKAVHLIVAKKNEIFILHVLRKNIFTKQNQLKLLNLKHKTGLNVFLTYPHSGKPQVREIK